MNLGNIARVAEFTCSIGVDLPPRLLDGFDIWFFCLCNVDGAGWGLVEEVLGVLPQSAVLHCDYLQRMAESAELAALFAAAAPASLRCMSLSGPNL